MEFLSKQSTSIQYSLHVAIQGGKEIWRNNTITLIEQYCYYSTIIRREHSDKELGRIKQALMKHYTNMLIHRNSYSTQQHHRGASSKNQGYWWDGCKRPSRSNDSQQASRRSHQQEREHFEDTIESGLWSHREGHRQLRQKRAWLIERTRSRRV